MLQNTNVTQGKCSTKNYCLTTILVKANLQIPGFIYFFFHLSRQ